MNLGAIEMQVLHDSTGLLDDASAMKEVLAHDGYLLLRHVVDVNDVMRVKECVVAWFRRGGYARAVSGSGDAEWLGADLAELGAYPADLLDLGAWEWFANRPTMRRLYTRIFGEPGIVLPIGQYQFAWPTRKDPASRIHQDGAYSTGLEFLVFWVPLMDIDEKVGGIELAVGQHHDSSLLAEYGLGPTNEGFIPRERLPEDSWGRADFEMGDVLIFDKFLPHCGLANAANRLRLSIDFRVQPASAPPPILGIVTDIDRDEITIRDGESQFIARATHRSVLRRSALFPSTERLDEYLGRRVIAVVDDSGELVLIRYQRGARWVSASGEGAGARARLG